MRSFHIKGVHIGGRTPVLMGILNLSPESFYSGSFVPVTSIRETAEKMVESGADMLDVGARSTAPGSTPISVSEECSRVEQCLSLLNDVGCPFSIDTMHPEVLSIALRYDVSMVNDISGLKNPGMGALIADSSIPAVLMAAKEKPGDSHSFQETIARIQQVLKRAESFHIRDILLDPGIGKWIPERTASADWELCRRFSELQSFNLPLLAAVSRKSFIGEATGRSPEGRLAGTLAVTTSLIEKGAAVIRAHDIPETRDVIKTLGYLTE